jgi:hypothetical protein
MSQFVEKHRGVLPAAFGLQLLGVFSQPLPALEGRQGLQFHAIVNVPRYPLVNCSSRHIQLSSNLSGARRFLPYFDELPRRWSSFCLSPGHGRASSRYGTRYSSRHDPSYALKDAQMKFGGTRNNALGKAFDEIRIAK